MILLPTDLTFKRFGSQLIRDSSDLIVTHLFGVQMV